MLVHNVRIRLTRFCLIIVAAVCYGGTLHAQGDLTNEIADLTFDDIKFEMEIDSPFKREYLTDRIHELDGKNIRIRGYILPSSETMITKPFILVRDNQECCFGPGAALCDCILVRPEKGHAVRFTVRPVTVEGKFYVKEKKIGGRVLVVFNMKNCKIR